LESWMTSGMIEQIYNQTQQVYKQLFHVELMVDRWWTWTAISAENDRPAVFLCTDSKHAGLFTL
jgi:hypothetical protein